jgi:hypothetical protein
MNAATIVPEPYLHLIENDTYHMCLAHLIGKVGFEEYTKFYGRIGGRLGKFLIMDNGVVEGDPRPIEELVHKAHGVNADELVLPDMFYDKEATLEIAANALAYVKVTSSKRTMVVPQGKDFVEWFDCARTMLTWDVDTIGIPKLLVKMLGRDGRLEALEALQPFLGDKDVHMLGCYESPLELKLIENQVRAGKIKPVRSVDSAIAYVYARSGIKMCDAERPIGTVNFAAEDADIEILKFNIEMWHSETATLPPLSNSDKVFRLFQ